MTELAPARAVEMQKAGMSAKEIATEFGVSPQQVQAWWRHMGHNPLVYHADTIRELLDNGATMSAAVQAVGLSSNSDTWARMTELGLRPTDAARRGAQLRRRTDTRPKCVRCEILLEPYDPKDPEQRWCGNGTRDGIHCVICEDILKHGGGYVARTELAGIPLQIEEQDRWTE